LTVPGQSGAGKFCADNSGAGHFGAGQFRRRTFRRRTIRPGQFGAKYI